MQTLWLLIGDRSTFRNFGLLKSKLTSGFCNWYSSLPTAIILSLEILSITDLEELWDGSWEYVRFSKVMAGSAILSVNEEHLLNDFLLINSCVAVKGITDMSNNVASQLHYLYKMFVVHIHN